MLVTLMFFMLVGASIGAAALAFMMFVPDRENRPRDPPKTPPLPVLLMIVLVASCSGTQKRTPAQILAINVHVLAHGLDAVDNVVSTAIQRDAALPHEPGAVNAKWGNVVTLAEQTRSALIEAEVDIARFAAASGTACKAYEAARAVLGKTDEFKASLPAVGVAVPKALDDAIPVLTSAVAALGAHCPSGGAL